jgi:oxalate decarboxylase/phosphoglucose isomerase-like protein (cupin superfamily)
MKANIKHLDLNDEFYTAEGCYITEVSNSPDDPGLSIARARVKPGITTTWHRLNDITERYYILNGRGRMEVGKLAPQKVTAGDVIIIPPLCLQRITNTGADDLIFLAICTPRFGNEAYEDRENETTANDPDV